VSQSAPEEAPGRRKVFDATIFRLKEVGEKAHTNVKGLTGKVRLCPVRLWLRWDYARAFNEKSGCGDSGSDESAVGSYVGACPVVWNDADSNVDAAFDSCVGESICTADNCSGFGAIFFRACGGAIG
jgi:hypothetical protein